MSDDVYSPVPAGPDAPTPSHSHFRFGMPTRTWQYLDEKQDVLYYVCRYDPPFVNAADVTRKQFCPQTWDGKKWRWKAWPSKRAIYNLDRLRAQSEAPVAVCEGEKSADAAEELLPRCVATTASGGKGALKHADWSPLYGRKTVILWPDAGEQGASLAAFTELAAHLAEHSPATTIRIIDPGDGLPDGWDAADALAANMTPASIAEWARTRTSVYDGPRVSPWAEQERQEPTRRINGHDRELSREIDRQETERQSAPEFGDPQDFFGKLILPALKPEHLPAALREFVFDQSALVGSDPGILAMSSIVSIAGAADDRWRVDMKQHDGGGFSERPCLWGAWIAGASARKSPASKKAIRILSDIDYEWSERYMKQLEEFKIEQRVHKECEAKYIKDRAKAAMNGGGYSSRVQPPIPPADRRLITQDATTESMALLLRENARGITFAADELSSWFGLMDAYNSSGSSLDRPRWLELYEGGPKRIDRVARKDDPIMVPNWSACVMGGIQPDAIRKIAIKLPEDGLLQRFMITMAADAVDDEDRPFNAAAKSRYAATIRRLAESQPPTFRVTMSNEARQEFRWFSRDTIEAMQLGLMSPRMKSHIGKFDGLFGRLCITYHLADAADQNVPPGAQITGKTASTVADFIREYLLGHMLTFYEELLSDVAFRQHSAWIAGHILTHSLTELTSSRLQQNYPAWKPLPDWERDRTMRILEDGNWLTPLVRDAPGRRTTRWSVNPQAHLKFAKYRDEEAGRRRTASDAAERNALLRALSRRT